MSMEMQQIQEFTQSTTSTSRVNGAFEETGNIQESGGSNPMLQKIMTPASMEYDTGSLKKKDPKKMFTDSSFYNSKYHPTIADQVEMAHKLSSAMFNEQNKGTKGAKMYLTRMENSGGFGDDTPKHDNVPNMKLVMNPEGKVHVWDDLPPEQRPDMGQLATHAAPNLSLPDVADPVAESLQAGVGRGGELFNKRKQKADSWIVDESTVGRINPGAVADKFIQEQSQQQLATQQQKMYEQQQKQQIQQQREAQQTFMQQQQFKQEQSMEVRRIQEMAQQQIDFPQDFQHTSLKARSYTPSLDLGCHNVQGINVWANTAPRGWGSSRTGGTPTRGAIATPGPGISGAAEGEMMARMEETRLREQEERLMMEEEQRMEAVRMQQQQEEQMRLKQEREEQMRREREEMMRQEEERRRLEQEKLQLEEERRRLEEERFRQEELRRQEEEMRRQQEEMKRQEAEQLRIEQMRQQEQEQRQRLEQEEMFRQAEMKRQEEERQRQQQMQMQQQQEQMIIQQQREQQQQMQMQQQQQREQQQQMQMQQQQREQQQQMQMQQQQFAQQQQMQVQQQHHQTTSMTTQEQKISSITKAGGFSYGAIPTNKSQLQQAAMPAISSSSQSFESSQSQQFSSVQQSSSSVQQQSHSEIYESQEFNGGVMKGYRRKDEASTNGSSNGARDSGIFTGINGDANSLVDETFDYKKHTVKDLAAHFALVKPKQNIPSNILPEQRIFNGGQAPQLNYLGANEAGATVTSQKTTRRELSQQDIEASKQAYEMKKKQQMEAKQTTTTTTTDSSSVVRRTTETSSEQSERRMSLRDSLMLDPAQAHADAGLIDPSAILRGSDITGRKSTTEGMNQSSVEGETDKVMNKWDNHNTIARGWAGMSKNYQPVTFRSIYNIGNKQESSFQL